MNTVSPGDNADGGDPIDANPHLRAFLYTMHKAHAEVVGREAARRRFALVHNKQHARQYVEELMPVLVRERDKRRAQRRTRQA